MSNITASPSVTQTFTISSNPTGDDVIIYLQATASGTLNQVASMTARIQDSSGTGLDDIGWNDLQQYIDGTNLEVGAGTQTSWVLPNFTLTAQQYNSYKVGSGNNSAPTQGSQFANLQLTVPSSTSFPITVTVYALLQNSASIGGTPSASAMGPVQTFGGGDNQPNLQGLRVGVNDDSSDYDFNDTVFSAWIYTGSQD